MPSWLLITLSGACAPTSTPPAAPHALEASWLGELRRDPALFARWTEPGREGWVALHAHQLPAAASAPGPAAALASAALARLHADLTRLSTQAWAGVALTWQAQAGLPEGSALGWFAGLAALDAGDAAAAEGWLEHSASRGSPEARQAAQALLSAGLDLEALPESTNPLLQRVHRVRGARARGEALAADAALPAWEEQAGPARRQFYDPLLPRTQALAWAARPGPAPGGPPLFSPCLDGAPLDPLACTQAALAALAVPPLGEGDDAEAARALGRALDAALDAWAQGPLADASPEAQELVHGLDLLDRLRAQWLEALAREALRQGRPRQALALAQIALDLESPRAIGPVNSPSLYALGAEAALRTGHVREALDPLEVLARSYPEARGLDELLSDLAILTAMNRTGESKEN